MKWNYVDEVAAWLTAASRFISISPIQSHFSSEGMSK
jgi:hypothetical protein